MSETLGECVETFVKSFDKCLDTSDECLETVDTCLIRLNESLKGKDSRALLEILS